MELELGLKITKTKDDIGSISEYRLIKERTGPVFQSRETNTMFILTAHLKGYKRNNIDIKISEDGRKISISGEKPIQEMLMMGWVMQRKEVGITGFNKVFKIPDGVILDRIKAKYDEEEWMLNIVMPKLVKGISGARIEEIKETESSRQRLELEKSEAETSQKGYEEFEVQAKEDSEGFMEKKERELYDKMHDDTNKEIAEETTEKEVEEPKLGNEDGNVESVREKAGLGKEGYEVMKTSELEQNVGVLIGNTSQDKESEIQKLKDSNIVEKKEGGESDKVLDGANGDITKLRIEDGKVKGMREKVGKAAYEEIETSEREQDVKSGIIDSIGDGSEDKESKVQEMEGKGSVMEKEKIVSEKMLVDAKGNYMTEEMTRKEEGSKLGIGDGNGQKESDIQQMEETKSTVEKIEKEESGNMIVETKGDSTEEDTSEESKQKEFGELKCKTEDIVRESVKESSKQELQAEKTTELDQNEVDHIPSKVGDISQEEVTKSPIQQMEKTERIVEKIDEGESETMPVKAKKDFQRRIFGDTIQKDFKKPETETKHGDQECVKEKASKEEFDAMKTTREEVSKEIPKATLDESEDLKVSNMQEAEDDKEAIVLKKAKEIENFEEKDEGEEPKRMQVESKKDKRKETMQEEIEKIKNGIKDSDQQNVQKSTDRGISEVPNKRDLPKQVGELDGSKGFKDEKMEALNEVIKEATAETECLMEKVKEEESRKRTEESRSVTEKSTVTEKSHIERKTRDEPHKKDKIEYDTEKLKGEGSKKIDIEPNEVVEKDTTRDKTEKEIAKPKFMVSGQQSGQDKVHLGGSDRSKRGKYQEMRKTEDAKEVKAKFEQPVKKLDGDKYEKIQVEGSGGFRKDITRESTSKEKDKDHMQEEMSKGRFEASKNAKEDFPMKMVDSLANKRGEPKGTKIEAAKEVNEELIKKKSEEKMEKIEVKEKGADIEHVVKKVKEDKANVGSKKDKTWKEAEKTKIHGKEKDQQRLQEEMRKRRYEASTTAREFPQQIIDSLAKTKEGPKEKEIEEEKVAKGKSDETIAVGSTIKEKIQEFESERFSQRLQEVPEEKYPKASETGITERELHSTKVPTTGAKVASMGFKEVEQRSAKDKKQKTELLSSKIQSKETHESINESANQDILKPKKAKEVKGEQGTQNIESTKVVATIEDQVAKTLSAPWLPSTEQSKVEENDKLQAKHESQKEDPRKDLKTLTEKKNQESRKRETLKPEIPPENLLKKGELVRKGEFHEGEKVEEKLQEETEGPKDKIHDKDQHYVQGDVDKGVGKVETKGKKMPKKEHVADSSPKDERMETKRDLKAAPERDKYITTQNVNDEKPRIHEEIIKADTEKVDKAKGIGESMKTTQEKEEPIESQIVKKEAESFEAISSLPSATIMGIKEAEPKNVGKELPQKELSHLTATIKSKDPTDLENSVKERKFPKIKEYVPESRVTEQYGYLTEDSEAPKIAEYQGDKPSNFVEEHEASRESPTKSIAENEKMERMQPQHSQENNDRKGYQATKAIEEELFKGVHREEVVHEKMEGSKFAKSEEAKKASRQLLKREREEETTQTAEDKKPKMMKTTSVLEKASGVKQVAKEMDKTREREHKTEPEEVTSKMGIEFEPPPRVETTPKRGNEKSLTEEKPPLPIEIGRKEPHELSWPRLDYEIPKIDEVQQEKEGKRQNYALEAITSKEGLAQPAAAHSKVRSNVEPNVDTDKPEVNQLPSPSIEMSIEEPHELYEFCMKGNDSMVESSAQVQEERDIEGTKASEAVADKVAEPSMISSLSSTQQFRVEGTDKQDASHEVGKQESQESKKDTKFDDVEESTECKTHQQEVEQIEALLPESPAAQQCINKDQEGSHGIHEIEEENLYEQGDEACEEDSQVLEEQKECKEHEKLSGGKKEDTKRSRKLFVPLVIAGSAILVSIIVIFVRHRRARKRCKRAMQQLKS